MLLQKIFLIFHYFFIYRHHLNNVLVKTQSLTYGKFLSLYLKKARNLFGFSDDIKKYLVVDYLKNIVKILFVTMSLYIIRNKNYFEYFPCTNYY